MHWWWIWEVTDMSGPWGCTRLEPAVATTNNTHVPNSNPITFCTKAPIRIRFDQMVHGTFGLRRHTSRQLHADSNCKVNFPTSSNTQRRLFSIPLLKSNLQKAVRRQHLAAVLASIAALVHQDRAELLRRLPIIAVEDVCWIEGFDVIVWLMVAVSQGYGLTAADLWLVFDFAHRLVKNDTICPFESEWHNPHMPTLSFATLFDQCMRPENREGAGRLFSVLIRMSYGGMKGDMNLLRRVASVCVHPWHSCRHTTPHSHFPLSAERTRLYEIFVNRNMRNAEQLMAAVDFHCTGVTRALKQVADVPETTLKTVMWEYHSSCNNRRRKEYTIPPPWWTHRVVPWLEKNYRRYWNAPPVVSVNDTGQEQTSSRAQNGSSRKRRPSHALPITTIFNSWFKKAKSNTVPFCDD